MKKSLYQGVTTPLFQISLPIDTMSNWMMFYSVQSKDSVNHKVVNMNGLHYGFSSNRNGIYVQSLVQDYQSAIATDGVLTFTISQAASAGFVTVSVNPSQATFTPTSITIFFYVFPLNDNTLSFL